MERGYLHQYVLLVSLYYMFIFVLSVVICKGKKRKIKSPLNAILMLHARCKACHVPFHTRS